METSIDEGLETEGEAEEDPSQAFDAFQSTRSGQRRHTLSEVTNQLVMMPGSGMITSDPGEAFTASTHTPVSTT